MKIFVVISLLLILSGCVSAPPSVTILDVGPKELPATIDNEIVGKIVVVRISSFFAVLVDYSIYIDGKYICSIGSGEYTELYLPQGEHSITLENYQMQGFTSGRIHKQTLNFNVTDSENIYFLLTPWSWKAAKIQLSNETEAKKHIEQGKFIDLKN